MATSNSSKKICLLLTLLAVGISCTLRPALGQSSAPKQEKLLNGLKVLMWPDQKADKVFVAIRIDSGAAFDPQGKEGLMQMLSSNLFPNAAAVDFFAEDLGGSLAVNATYDFIQLNASAKPDSFLTMLETLASAVSNPEIDKENTVRLKTAQLELVDKRSHDAAIVADDAVAARLFGTFPYGRPIYGTAASVQKIEFADLIGAKQRFLTADNATIAITGNFDRSSALKAIRRYFGGWLKSDKRVPSTFRQPEDPAAAVLQVPSPSDGKTEIRFASRGTGRSDKDLGSSLLFAKILENRLRSNIPPGHAADVFVRSEPHLLPGMFIVGFSAAHSNGETSKLEANTLLTKAIGDPIRDTEVEAARSDVRAEWQKTSAVDRWLDADTYQIADVDADSRIVDKTTVADVKAYADRFRQRPMAAVLVNTRVK